MPPQGAKRDPLSLSQHFKLCGFLKLVVSVKTNWTHPSISGSSVSNPYGETPAQRPQQRCGGRHPKADFCCSEVVGPSSFGLCEGRLCGTQSSGCLFHESEQSRTNVSGEVACLGVNCHGNTSCKHGEFCPQEGESSGRSPSGVHNDSDILSSTIVNDLTGAECWFAQEASEVLLHTDTGFVLRSVNSDKLNFISADSDQGCFGTTDSDLTTEVVEPRLGSAEEGYRSGGLEEGNDASPTFSASEISSLCNAKVDLKAESASPTPQSDRTNNVGEIKINFDGKARRKAGHANGSGDILHQLQLLTARNCVKIKGHIVLVACRGADVRAVVLLDLHLSSCLWSGRNYWKPGPIAATVFNHISCDWEIRKKYLAAAGQKLENVDIKELWNLGECEVLGCEIHFQASEEVKRTRFNLHALFKSVPSLNKQENGYKSVISPNHRLKPRQSGIWDIPDDILSSVFSWLLPRDLQSVAAVCRHARELAVSIMPCMNLKLFPHQQAAVQWMLRRELNPQPAAHPLYRDLQTEDGFHFYINCFSGDLSPEPPPSVMDFRGGLFCDEPGLGKTVTALSLILKTQGTLSVPPTGTQVRWCDHRSGDRYGYYEISLAPGASVFKRCMDLKARRNRFNISPSESESVHNLSKRPKHSSSGSSAASRPSRRRSSDSGPESRNSVKRKLLETYGEFSTDQLGFVHSLKEQRSAVMLNTTLMDGQHAKLKKSKRGREVLPELYEDSDVWVQCDSCSKWRKLPDGGKLPEGGLAWFCNMSKDPLHQSCSDPEENWDDSGAIKSLPGYYKVGSSPGQEQNIAHFATVLKEYSYARNSEINAALTWLANLPTEKLEKMAGSGVTVPSGLGQISVFGDDMHGYHKIFQRFGLVLNRERKGVRKWCYPQCLDNLVFDLPALREALTRPVDLTRMYLSRATLIVVPPNLVEHWKNQILRHTKPGQLRVCVWMEQKKPPLAQDLAWNYDVVITTFPRLSAEWSLRESSVLMSVHWLRIMLDEGHTLGSSLSITNKLQMAVSMQASRRWLLTGTPTPNTPNSQVAHLQPMLKFLHEEIYGGYQKSWEGGILKPFEAGREEGRIRLLQLLQRCMISARKSDLCTIPPCVRKVTLLDFTQKHAESYNELVVTVRRNILMADWKDPSHVESLLNPKQWKFRSNTIRNVRLSCCVAGHIKVRNAGEDIKETMEILAQQGMDPMSLEFAVIRAALLYGGNCERCEEWCRLPIVTPCKHLLCLDCVALDRERCTLPGCGHPYVMQSPEDLARPENPNPKWPVPQDLIELQPSYVQDNWDPDWEATSSSKVMYLVERLKTLQGHTPKEEDGVEFNPEPDSSSFHCMGPDQYQNSQNQQISFPEKAIVFSQFLEHINAIQTQLTEAGIKVATLYCPMHSANKMKSLLNFQNDRDCTVLLMDGSAALGLDLSFVTHVFLMEPIWDRSVEEQVVSRAHRMGATRPVLVETLAMRGTIEEQMLRFLQDPAEHSRALKGQVFENGRSSYRTVHEFAESSYLARLSFVRTKSGS